MECYYRRVRTETQIDSRPGSKQSTLNISERAELEIFRSLLCEPKRIIFQFIKQHKKNWPIKVMWRVMQASSSAFYAWGNMPIEPFDGLGFNLDCTVKNTFKTHRITLGSRRVVTELAIGRYKARSTMGKLGLVARYPQKYQTTTDSNHNNRIEPHKLNRQFTVEEANRYHG
ncbi:MAG: hypothetical protein ACI8UC_000829 [Psychromonas sp.]|jgi:hypothetical protein